MNDVERLLEQVGPCSWSEFTWVATVIRDLMDEQRALMREQQVLIKLIHAKQHGHLSQLLDPADLARRLVDLLEQETGA